MTALLQGKTVGWTLVPFFEQEDKINVQVAEFDHIFDARIDGHVIIMSRIGL